MAYIRHSATIARQKKHNAFGGADEANVQRIEVAIYTDCAQ